jgi:predicted site-specific integrase-resolvase
MNTEDKIDPTKAADILGVTRARLRQFVASGELKTAGMFGNTTMFSETEVRDLKVKRDAAKKNGNRKVGK